MMMSVATYRYAGAPTGTRVSSFFHFCSSGNITFSEHFCTIAVFSLYGEYVVRFFVPDGVFPPCDHGLDFFYTSYVRIQSISQPIDQSKVIDPSWPQAVWQGQRRSKLIVI